MNKYLQVILEGIVVGVCLVLVGYVVSYSTKPYFKVSLPEICDSWNNKYVYEITLFMSGFLLHIIFELVGLNRYYCNYMK